MFAGPQGSTIQQIFEKEPDLGVFYISHLSSLIVYRLSSIYHLSWIHKIQYYNTKFHTLLPILAVAETAPVDEGISMSPYPKNNRTGAHFYIDKQILMEFRRLAYEKHGNFHGALSYEAEEALRNWILLHTQNRTRSLIMQKVNPQPRVFRVFGAVKEYLKEKYAYAALIPGQQIPRRHLIEAISQVRGMDERTIKAWLQRFTAAKLIKYVAGEIYEVL